MIRYLSKVLMQHDETFQRLLRSRNDGKMTPFEYALKSNARTVQSLLITPATVAAMTDSYPLHYAATKGSCEAVELLLEKGMGLDVNVINGRGETPLYRACCAYPEAHHVVALLLSRGANLNISAINGKSPRAEAAARQYHRTVKVIDDHIKAHD